MWETERLRETKPARLAPTVPAEESLNRAMDKLLAALRTLHARAGSPPAYQIAVASQWRLTPDQATTMLDGGGTEDWKDLAKFLFVLGGDHGYFRPLWQAARDSVDRLQTCAPAAQEPPLPPAGEDVSRRVPGLLERYSGVLGSRPHLSPRQERVLKAKQKAVLASLAERSDSLTGQPPHKAGPATPSDQ
ncbi:hypothetical protein [Kitasatospora sp. NPDC056181]|uniref:hypothetical protein n=1 Tax=Kitasatospora sp. NPDC056181 TaxID=3345737 RepID=UPI0035DBAFF3